MPIEKAKNNWGPNLILTLYFSLAIFRSQASKSLGNNTIDISGHLLFSSKRIPSAAKKAPINPFVASSLERYQTQLTCQSMKNVFCVAPITHCKKGVYPNKTHGFRKALDQLQKLLKKLSPVVWLDCFCNFLPLKDKEGNYMHDSVDFPHISKHFLNLPYNFDMTDVVVAQAAIKPNCVVSHILIDDGLSRVFR